MARRSRLKIYTSRWHLLATFAFIALPLIFLLFFSKIANIPAGNLLKNISVSIGRLFVAYFISVALGWFLAVSFYSGRRAAVALPIFDVLQSFPTSAALPIGTFILGKTNFTVITFLVLAVIWPIIFSIISSLKLIRNDWQEAAEIAGLRGYKYIKFFLWPVSIPGLITGTVIGLGDGWEALVATEIIVGIKSGLGGFFSAFSQNSGITVLGILAFLLIIFSINKLIWLPLLEKSHEKLSE